MPFRREEPNRAPVAGNLVTELADELRRGRNREASPQGAPDIIEEVSLTGIVHVTVIWGAWGDVLREDRGRVILDAYRIVDGEEEIRKISIALGLTPAEADRLGISF